MSPSGARHVARHVCWFKAARTLAGAMFELGLRLGVEDAPEGGIYRCPFSPPGEEPHYHLTTETGRGHSTAKVAEALEVLGADAWRKEVSA